MHFESRFIFIFCWASEKKIKSWPVPRAANAFLKPCLLLMVDFGIIMDKSQMEEIMEKSISVIYGWKCMKFSLDNGSKKKKSTTKVLDGRSTQLQHFDRALFFHLHVL